jgi:PTS system galactitol-specific IIA component
MNKPVLNQDLILFPDGEQNRSRESVIRLMADWLTEYGYTSDSYADQVLLREDQYPTGLPTQPVATAIPHADSTGVFHTGICIAVLKEPVEFQSIEAPEETLEVYLICLLAIAEKKLQVKVLQWLSELLQDQILLNTLISLQTPKDVLDALGSRQDALLLIDQKEE